MHRTPKTQPIPTEPRQDGADSGRDGVRSKPRRAPAATRGDEIFACGRVLGSRSPGVRGVLPAGHRRATRKLCARYRAGKGSMLVDGLRTRRGDWSRRARKLASFGAPSREPSPPRSWARAWAELGATPRPESCGKVGRHVCPKVTHGDRGDRRRRRNVAKRLPQTCRQVVPEAEIGPKFGPKLADVGKRSSQLSRCLADLGRK